MSEEDFALAFSVIEVDGEPSTLEAPEGLELDASLFAEVEKIFEKKLLLHPVFVSMHSKQEDA